MEKIRVVLAEDNDDLRRVIGLLIDEEPDMVCVASTALLADVERLVKRHHANIALLDLELRDGLVMPHLAALCSSNPSTRFIIHSGHVNPDLESRTYEAGARAYLAKSGDPDELIATIRSVAAV